MHRFLKVAFLLVFTVLFAVPRAHAQEDGEKLYKAYCQSCHSMTDQKRTGPGFAGVFERWGGDRAEMKKMIQLGYQGYVDGGGALADYVKQLKDQMGGAIMPAQPVNDAQVEALLTYIETNARVAAPAAPGGGATAGAPAAAADQSPLFDGLTVLVGVLVFAVIALILIIAVVLIALRAKEQGERFQIGKVQNLLRGMWSNSFFKGAIGFIVFLFLMSVVIDFARGVGLHQNYKPVQPIAFSHKLHAGQYEIDCQYCHIGVEIGKSATIPSTNICANCHHERGGIVASQYQFEGDPNFDATAEIQKVLASYSNNTPIEWVRIHNLPDLVYFNHAQHVKVAGLECQQCHGEVQNMDEVYQVNVLSMGWCINCHRETEVDVTKSDYYRQVHGNYIGSEERVTVETLGGLNCARCHY